MMVRLPSYTAADVDRALRRGGFVVSHPRGSHRYYLSPKTGKVVTAVPMHPGDVARPLLKKDHTWFRIDRRRVPRASLRCQHALPILSAVEDSQNGDAIRVDGECNCHTTLESGDPHSLTKVISSVTPLRGGVETPAERLNPIDIALRDKFVCPVGHPIVEPPKIFDRLGCKNNSPAFHAFARRRLS